MVTNRVTNKENFHKKKMIFLNFLSIFLLIYASQNNFVASNEQNLMRYVCKVTENVIKSENDIKDVTIGSINSRLSPDFTNSLVKCISSHAIVITSDFKVRIESKKLRKSQIVIIISDDIDTVSNFLISGKIFLVVMENLK